MTSANQNLKELAHQHFGVQLPVQRDILKTLYRRAARRLHTDLSGTDLTKDAFVAMQQAYEALTAPNAQGVFVDGPRIACTEEGTPLDDLGKGLGALVNGKECHVCKGAGYSSRKKRVILWWPYDPCPICKTMGSTWGCQTCGRLNFQHKDEVKLVHAVCATCQGTGEVEIFNPVIPKGFLGMGNMTQKERKRYARTSQSST